MNFAKLENDHLLFYTNEYEKLVGPDVWEARNMAGCRSCMRGIPADGELEFVSIVNGLAQFSCNRLSMTSEVEASCRIRLVPSE